MQRYAGGGRVGGCSWAEVAERATFSAHPASPLSISLSVFRAHSLATGAALNCFSFQTLETECSDLASPADSLTVNMEGAVTWEENMPSISGRMNQTDERDSFEKLAVLFGVCQRSDWFIWREVMEGKVSLFPFLDRKGKLGAIGRRFCVHFLLFLTPGIRVVKKNPPKNKRKEWAGKERHGVEGRGGQKRDWREKSERDRGKKWEREARQTENKKQVGSPRISSPATHYAAKQCNLPRTESQLPQSKAALPALSKAS